MIDFYQTMNMDASIALVYPKTMTGVSSAVVEMLNKRGKLVVDEGDITVARARELVEQATGDTDTFYRITSTSKNVWAILRPALLAESLKVLGVFHTSPPDFVPENVVRIDVGKSLVRKVPREVALSISEALKPSSRGRFKYPVGKPEDLYNGIRALSYEALYSPEFRIFPKEVSQWIPKSVAFNFMFNPPQPLTEVKMRSAVTSFVDDLNG